MSAIAQATSSAPPVLDFEALLEPIPGDNPAGTNVRYEGVYDAIREARRSEDDMAQGEWVRETKVADWQQVVELATSALTERTKDLQVCAWLAEALAKMHGFVGVRDGLRLMREMHERFWEHVYPEEDEGDLEARANALAFMDAQVSRSLKEASITKSPTGLEYSFFDWEESKTFDIPENLSALDTEQLARIEERRATAAAEGKITSEDWRTAKNATRRAFYEGIYALLNESWNEFQALDRVMDEKFDRQTPGLGALKKALDEVRTLVERIVKEKRQLEPDPVLDAAAGDGEAISENGQGDGTGAVFVAGVSGPIRTRQDALRQLALVADFFARSEPHSPVSYLVQRAIKWGQMPLEAWLQEVIKDATVLDSLRETLGLSVSYTEGGETTEYTSE